jgi:hypothetical protein
MRPGPALRQYFFSCYGGTLGQIRELHKIGRLMQETHQFATSTACQPIENGNCFHGTVSIASGVFTALQQTLPAPPIIVLLSRTEHEIPSKYRYL